MIRVCIVSAAWGRFDVTRLALTQRQRLCAELAPSGIEAIPLIVADDENLELARAYCCETVEAANEPLGRKCNAGLQHAARTGADWVVWVGSDDWIHPDVFQPLLDERERPVSLISGNRLAIVDLATGRLQRINSPSKYGGLPWLIDARLFRTRKVQPIRPDLPRGLDGALVRGLRRSGIPFTLERHDPHEFRCVDFKTSSNLTSYAGSARNLALGEPEDAWSALGDWFDADLVAQAREVGAREAACATRC